jgi:hypothetical protein
MGESRRDFKIAYEAAVTAEQSAGDRLSQATNLASRLMLKGLVAYRKLDTAILRELAEIPKPVESPRLVYGGGSPTYAEMGIWDAGPGERAPLFIVGNPNEPGSPPYGGEAAKQLALDALKLVGADTEIVKKTEP